MAGETVWPIAIIGMGCRLPGGASDPDKLWELLSEGRDGWSEIPSSRWNANSFYHPNPDAPEAANTRAGHFLLEDISAFDPSLFGILPHEADSLDPQQRILLETTYEALENAGQTLGKIQGSDTSVHIAAFAHDYNRMGYTDISRASKFRMTGAGDAIISNRISYVFDLRGASATVDTGCSGSIVALHQACQTLRMGESRMAIAGGTNLIITPEETMLMSSFGLTNPDGRCYAFDSRGAGYGRGEGVVTLILKRLDDALEDGDPIHAVIRNSGVNQDGKTAGMTLPNSEAQIALMRSVYDSAGLDPRKTIFVEAHGTGTQAGDQAEIRSISQIFCQGRESPLLVGSIKSNIGHLEATSGLAGVMKATLALKNASVPPNVNFVHPKDGLLLEERKITIPRKLTPLPPANIHRISVNSFGYGGTNGHVILESAPPLDKPKSSGPETTNNIARKLDEKGHHVHQINDVDGVYINGHHDSKKEISDENACISDEVRMKNTSKTNGTSLADRSTGNVEYPSAMQARLFVLTAKSEMSLLGGIRELTAWIRRHDDQQFELNDLAATLAFRRNMFQWRHSIAAASRDELLVALEQKNIKATKASPSLRVVYLFNGQGAQWYAMGRELILYNCVFRKSIQRSEEIMKALGCGWSLLEELLRGESTSIVSESGVSQPACTAVQIALVDLFRGLGVRPYAVVGHSSGEIAAAYACEALSHEDAIKVSYPRGRVSDALKRHASSKGAMLAVGVGESEIEPFLSQTKTGLVSIACQNSPESTTISGDAEAVDELKILLDERDIWNRKLKVDTAYHSHHMEKVAVEYASTLSDMDVGVPNDEVKFYSSVTGKRKISEFGPTYWVDNLVSKVRFSDAVQELCKVDLLAKSPLLTSSSFNLFLEIGPHGSLAGPLRQIINQLRASDFHHSYVSALNRGSNAVHTTLKAIGTFFESGYPLDLNKASRLHEEKQSAGMMLDNLPPYSWDHSTSYWEESRLSRASRLRAFPNHDLLGTRVVSTNLDEPIWRNFINTSTLPWLRDHVVDGFVIFPGSGYLCMVIEAMKQLAQSHQQTKVVRYLMKDISFSKSLIIPTAEGGRNRAEQEVEVQLSLRRGRENWQSFRICSLAADEAWIEHCTGAVKVEYSSSTDEVEGDREQRFSQNAKVDLLQRLSLSCTQKLDPRDIYDDLKTNGNVFGETFTVLKEARIGEGEGLATLEIPDIAASMPFGFMQPHVIHPVTLDAFNHLALPLFKRNCSSGPVMPVGAAEITISAELTSKSGVELLVAVDFKSQDIRSGMANVTIYQKNEDLTRSAVMTISNLQLRSIGESRSAEKEVLFGHKMAYRVEWIVDIDLLHPVSDSTELVTCKVMKNACASTAQDITVSHEKQLIDDRQMVLYERAALYYVVSATTGGHGMSCGALPKQNRIQLLNWMTKLQTRDENQKLIAQTTEADRKSCFCDLPSSGVEGLALWRIGENLSGILQGTVDPLPLMHEDDLLDKLYGDCYARSHRHVADYVKLLAFKNPQLSVLEVSAKAHNSASAQILRSLQQNGRTLLKSYHYTDVSSDSFDAARSQLHEWAHLLTFQILDISRDLGEQGFSNHSYDLIIASNISHTTRLVEDSLANLRKLLKPGGRLVLIELTHLTTDLTLILGTLESWPFDGSRALNSARQWHNALIRHNFKGLERSLGDDGSPVRRSSVMISQAVEIPESNLPALPLVEIVNEINLGVAPFFAQELSSRLVAQNVRNLVVPWDLQQAPTDSIHVVIDDMEQPVLLSPTRERFDQIRRLVTSAKQVLWISIHGNDTAVAQPAHGLVTGLARVARRENDSMRFITLNVEQSLRENQSDVIQKVVDIVISCFGSRCDAQCSFEPEYLYRDDQVLIPRVIENIEFDTWVDNNLGRGKIQERIFHHTEHPLKMHIETPGILSSLVFVEDPAQLPLGPDEIEIDTRAFGVNFKDVFIALGQMAPKTRMVGECAGVVTAVGSALEDRFRVDDHVCAVAGVPFCSRVRVKGDYACRIPNSMSYSVGASIPVVFLTAYYCLVKVACLRQGQTVLIHAASGGVGQAAIILAQNAGATIFATVGKVSKRKLLIEQYNIPEGHIFSSRSTSFKSGILRLTQNKGVDVVLNSLSGEWLDESWACIAPMGTFLEIGKTDIYKKNSLRMDPFDRNVTFAAVDLAILFQLRSEEMANDLATILKMFDDKILRPIVPITTLRVGDVESAFRLIQSRKHVGKIVLEAGEEAVVRAVPTIAPLKFDVDATYVVAGGLGDLGRKICRFMAMHGAKHIVTLSRRMLDREAMEAFENELLSLGAKVYTMVCDITDPQIVEATALKCKQSLPSVRGIVNAGMVLRDHSLDLMTWEDYCTAIKPKVHGTKALDEHFSNPSLDFFIMLSSITCILGNPGQANYSAGNAFLDAYAHQRNQANSRTRFMSLNLGAIEDSDIINSLSQQQRELLRQELGLLMRPEEVLKALEYAMGLQTERCSQVILGFDRQATGISRDLTTPPNPFFSHLEQLAGGSSPDKIAASLDVSQSIQASQSPDEAQAIITRELAKKIALLVGCAANEVDVNLSIVDFGLDSLIAIELKNWIVRTFYAVMQTAEIFGAPSILRLAGVILSRSTLASAEIRANVSAKLHITRN
ncbi:MAG: hypothetical protein M1818_008380 [Claussenomyces sp. TS43310]|nr:MAG: hypothetical protein M1818_008380 [Claussenomyces sp. TS43310]